jgi:DNA polymerase-3 subunit gamma/tau
MAYQVIARKYRPQRFSDVVGQDHVTTTLSHAITQGRIAHAYLFCGPRGTGKTTVARIFAKCLNCTDGPKLDFPDDDPRCLEIAEGRSLDVMEIDGASNRGIDEIRALRDTVKYAPATSKFKVYIIDEVHMLTKEAFNALLKTLEEPPSHVKFMFATTEPEKVLPTILSRCQRFDLRRIPSSLIVQHLAHIAAQEQTSIDDAALYAIARGADGGMRDAESTLDQLISFCGDKIVENDVLSMFGLAAQSHVRQLFSSIISCDTPTSLRLLDELCRGGKDLGRLLGDLLEHGRNLLLTVVSKDRSALGDLPEAEIKSLEEEASGISLPELTRILEVLADGERRLRDASSRRIVFEVTLLRAMEARRAIGIDELLQKLEALRSGVTPPSAPAASAIPATTQPAPPKRPVTPPAQTVPAPERPAPQAAPPPPTPSTPPEATPNPPTPAATTSTGDVWSDLLQSLGNTNRFLQAYLIHAHPIGQEGECYTIGYDPQVAAQLDLVITDRNRQIILDRLREFGLNLSQVRFVEAKTPAGFSPPVIATPEETAPPAAPAAPAMAAPTQTTQAQEPKSQPSAPATPIVLDKASFENDPLIRKALEIFRGTIIEVRP